jgi:catalase
LGSIRQVVPKLLKKYGLKETRRILGVFLQPVVSFKPFQMNQYWSRTSYQFGTHAIRYLIRPSAGSKMLSSSQQLLGVLRSLMQGVPQRENYLREKLREALKESELRFDFCIQLFVDEQKTPIEDAYIEWKESDAPLIAVATLILSKQDFDPELEEAVERMAFNPWNTVDFTPLGRINLARKKVYEASARHRGASVKTA